MREAWRTGIADQRISFSLLVIISALAGIVTAFQPAITGRIIDVVSSGERDQVRSVVLVLIGLFVADGLLNVLGALLGAKVSGKFSHQLRERTLAAVATRQLGKGKVIEHGDAQNRILVDTSLANQSFVGAIPQAVSAFILLIGCMIGMANTLPRVFLFLILVIAVTALSAYFLGRVIRYVNTQYRESAAIYASTLWHIFESLRPLKSKNMLSWALSKASSNSDLLRRSGIKSDFTNGMMLPVLNIGTQVCLVLTIAMATSGILIGSVAPGEGTSFIMFLFYSISPLVQLGMLVPGWFAGDASVQRLQEMWALPLEGQGLKVVPTSTTPSLCFKNVCYRFPGEDDCLVKDLNLYLEGPGVFSLYGPNGVGKSTILFLANGIYPVEGVIEVNGENIQNIDQVSLRACVLVVDQDREPLDGTLRDNLGIGTSVSDDRRREIIRQTGFDRHLSDLDASIGESGISLSGGQRSLLALSDALLREPQVLLIDEITAGVDKETLPKVVDIIEKYARDHLVIAVSHDDSFGKISKGNVHIGDWKIYA